jgi:hypothetical protein
MRPLGRRGARSADPWARIVRLWPLDRPRGIRRGHRTIAAAAAAIAWRRAQIAAKDFVHWASKQGVLSLNLICQSARAPSGPDDGALNQLLLDADQAIAPRRAAVSPSAASTAFIASPRRRASIRPHGAHAGSPPPEPSAARRVVLALRDLWSAAVRPAQGHRATRPGTPASIDAGGRRELRGPPSGHPGRRQRSPRPTRSSAPATTHTTPMMPTGRCRRRDRRDRARDQVRRDHERTFAITIAPLSAPALQKRGDQSLERRRRRRRARRERPPRHAFGAGAGARPSSIARRCSRSSSRPSSGWRR